ncbi:non-ribosomal peptide synthetase [Capsulimonas corticalis]|nr:non-ribosomal peptide synthetase [Capsulimonas corticalis]
MKIQDLSPAKRALLELRLKQQNRLTDNAAIPRRALESATPLSYTQELLWLQHQMTPGSAYNVPRAMRLEGELDIDALSATLVDLVRRHEILRTRYMEVDGHPVQVIDADVPPMLETIDLRSLPETDREAEVAKLVYERVSRPFDLRVDRLLKATLLRLSPLENVLILVTHHIASDGWSRDVLFRELSALYDAHHRGEPAQLPEMPIQYADYAVWQRDALQGETLQKEMDYWKRKLAGAPALLELPIDYPRPTTQTFEGAIVRRHVLTHGELTRLKAIGLEEKATLFMTVLACVKTLLYRHTGQDDIVVGTPISGRDRAETQNLLGYFMNTLALRTGFSGQSTFREMLREVRSTTLGAFEHQNAPYVKLFREMNPERNFSYNPVFQVLFGFGRGATAPFTLANIISTPFAVDRGVSKFDLTISSSEVESGLLVGFEYNTALFRPETVAAMADRMGILMKGILENPDIPIADLPLIGGAERRQLLEEWSGAQADYPAASSLQELFEAQARRTPDTVAVEFPGCALTYAQLNARANQTAHLLQSYGIGPNAPVGVLMERAPDLIVALLGILKSGGAYVPLDTAFPSERIQTILATAAATLVVTQQSLTGRLAGFEGCIVPLDHKANPLNQQDDRNPESATSPNDLAYVMFTSGSTGRPKGVAVTHASLTHYVRAAAQTYGLKSTDRVLQFASICFDTSIEEIFPCLTIGATLVVRTREMLDTLADFWKLAGEWRLTFLSLPTAFWHELARAASNHADAIPPSLRLIVIGGEKARADRLATWRKYYGQTVQIINTYGPTEGTVVATACDITADESSEIPIGHPLPNVRVYVLDEWEQPVPRGVTGEIYIGGAGVARGYLNDAARTEERFLSSPFVSGDRLYRSGDLGRYRADGEIEFMGRRDNQIKIRGFRIELGEIENALALHPGVADAAALAPVVDGDEHRIAVYAAPAPGGDLTGEALRTYLQERLPSYMVPAKLVILDTLPKTPGGKVDKRALPAIDWTESEETDEIQEPGSPIEEDLAAIWRDVLGLARVSPYTSFFDLGGHSLLAIRLLSEVNKAFSASLTLAEMLRAPTIHAMADLLRSQDEGTHTWSPLIALRASGSLPPLFCAPVGGGSAFYYRTMATLIGDDQPVYTFEPIGMNGVDEPHESVEELAAYYIKHMRAVQPQGPYHLCGLSFGGLVAFEMARQLRASGQKVASLIVFDTLAPGLKDAGSQTGSKVRRVGRAARYAVLFHRENLSACRPGDRLPYLRSRTHKLVGKLIQARGQLWKWTNENPISRELPEVFLKVKRAEQRARAKYHPTPYAGEFLLLRAHLQYRRSGRDELLGWEGMAECIDVIETPGTHFSLLEEPCVHITLGHIRSALDKASGAERPLTTHGRTFAFRLGARSE